MKINLVLTGGTIGSSQNHEGVIDTDIISASKLLIDDLYIKEPSYKDSIDFDISSPIDMLSENLSFYQWNELIRHLKAIDIEKTDGIIVTHGTDTLAFTANLFSVIFDGIDIPVFLVSSAKPLTFENANGFDNFRKAVDMISDKVAPGVYVPFRNKDGEMNIHQGNMLVQADDLSPDFESCHHKLNNIEMVKRMLFKAPHNYDNSNQDVLKTETHLHKPLLCSINELYSNILTIDPAPGLDYGNYNLENVDCVLHRTYHSSTLAENTGQYSQYSVHTLMERCRKNNIDIFFTPVLSQSKQVYGSTDSIKKRGLIPLFDMTYEMSYIYLILKFSLK